MRNERRSPPTALIKLQILLTLALANVCSSTAAPAADALESSLRARLDEMECPGALVGIFPDRGPVERYALGVADVKTRAPLTLDMHMRVASVTKLFLGTVVLQLVDEGSLNLDNSIATYVEGVPEGERITLRHLGTNTSGLFNSIENKDLQYAIMDRPQRDWTPEEILDYAFAREAYAEPGERFRYSNTNAVLLGLVVEKVTGKSWQQAIAERVCKPLQLAHTGVPAAGGTLPDPHPSAYRNGYADKVIGYGDTFYDVSNYSASWTGPAGDMYSTLDDLGRAIRPLATGELLEDQGRKVLHSWIKTGYMDVEYGFCIGKRDGGIGHTGDVPGFNASAFYLPELQRTVIVLTNLSNNNDRKTMPAEELARLVVEHLRAKAAPAAAKSP